MANIKSIPAFLIIIMLVLSVFDSNAQSKKSTSAQSKKAIPTIMKPVSELADSVTAWNVIIGQIKAARNKIEILSKEVLRADSALYHAQINESNPLGAMIYNTGGILVDDGWIRLLGSGCQKLNRSLPQWNKGKSFKDYGEQATYLLVADDVLGGLFAINRGGIDKNNMDMIYYYGPNSLMWLPIGLDYSQFLAFCFSGNIKDFYEEFYWKGWQTEVKNINCSDVISCFPLMWTRNGKNLMDCNRKVVSIQKQWSLYHGENEKSSSKSQKSITASNSDNR